MADYPGEVASLPLRNGAIVNRPDVTWFNLLTEEINAIEATLGINPQGDDLAYATVSERLDYIEGLSGGGGSSFQPVEFRPSTANLTNITTGNAAKFYTTANVDLTGVTSILVTVNLLVNSTSNVISYWKAAVGSSATVPSTPGNFLCVGTGIMMVFSSVLITSGLLSGNNPISLYADGPLTWTHEQYYNIHSVIVQRF